MEWNEMKWNEMEWNEMKWNEMKWNEMKWNEMEWTMDMFLAQPLRSQILSLHSTLRQQHSTV